MQTWAANQLASLIAAQVSTYTEVVCNVQTRQIASAASTSAQNDSVKPAMPTPGSFSTPPLGDPFKNHVRRFR
jgi:hypothetical protein